MVTTGKSMQVHTNPRRITRFNAFSVSVRLFLFERLVSGGNLVAQSFKRLKTKSVFPRTRLRSFRVKSALFIGSVFVVMAVQAQEGPIAAVGRIVHVVAVFMVDGQLAQSNAGELPPAALADVGEHFQRLFAVGLGFSIAVTF